MVLEVHLGHMFCVLEADLADAERIVWMTSLAGILQVKAFVTVLTQHAADAVNLLRPVCSEQ